MGGGQTGAQYLTFSTCTGDLCTGTWPTRTCALVSGPTCALAPAPHPPHLTSSVMVSLRLRAAASLRHPLHCRPGPAVWPCCVASCQAQLCAPAPSPPPLPTRRKAASAPILPSGSPPHCVLHRLSTEENACLSLGDVSGRLGRSRHCILHEPTPTSGRCRATASSSFPAFSMPPHLPCVLHRPTLTSAHAPATSLQPPCTCPGALEDALAPVRPRDCNHGAPT